MPTWRCPHCGTPQAETARCWVCRRSSTACATCRHYRRSVAAGMGYCGLDPRRTPLDGDEIRACWDAPPVLAATEPSAAPAIAIHRAPAAAIALAPTGFVEVVTAGLPDPPLEAPDDDHLAREPDATEPQRWPVVPDAGWSLWSEFEG